MKRKMHTLTKKKLQPLETLSSLLNLTNATTITNSTRRIKQVSPKFCFLDLQFSSEKVFVLCAMQDFRCIQLNRSELFTSGDIYAHKRKVLLRLQSEMHLNQQFKYLSLFNNEPIQFFQEVPQDCNLIFISASPQVDHWSSVFQNYQVSMHHLNQLLIVIQQLHTVESLKQILTDRDTFHQYVLNTPTSDMPFLTDIKPEFQKTRLLYTSKRIYDIEEKNLLNREPSISHTSHKSEVEEDIHDLRVIQRTEEAKDFSTMIHQPKQDELQRFLPPKIRQRQNKKASLQSIQVPSHRERHENRFTDFNAYVAKKQPSTMALNIPRLMQTTGFNRHEIHEVHSRYKALLSYECISNKNMTRRLVPQGISLKSFNAGLDELSMAPQGVVDQLYNFFAKANSLSFEGFLKALNLIRAKRNEDKIEMIIKLIDENENGLLSFEEIRNRSTLMMDQMLQENTGELSINNMVDYITRSIFDAVQMQYHEEIPVDKIRKLIDSRSQEAQVLIMMCCGDVNYID